MPEDDPRSSQAEGSAAASTVVSYAAAHANTAVAASGSVATLTSPSNVQTAVPITLRINGKDHQLRIDPRTTLLDCVRESVVLTGTKKGCDHGQCGACTV